MRPRRRSPRSNSGWRNWAPSILRDIPRWSFLALLIYTPWVYGGTTPSAIVSIERLSAVVLGFWLFEMVIRRRKPDLPRWLPVLSALILLVGWLAALNASAIYDSEFEVFIPVRRRFVFPPSSIDAAISVAWMTRTSILLGILLFVADLSARPIWLMRLWGTIAIAGGSIAFLGLVQKVTNAEMIFWGPNLLAPEAPWPFFATFYYHANAGAFLNLVTPLAAGLTLRAFKRSENSAQRGLWSTTLLLLGAGIFTNTSRMAQVLGIIMITALAVGPARQAFQYARSRNRVTLWSSVAMIALVLVVIIQTSGAAKAAKRWHGALEEIPNDDRWKGQSLAIEAVRDAGWFGFGPGTFRAVFPVYERDHGVKNPGGWRNLHQDYLQTILEWGWAGAACWAAIFFGGIGTGSWALVKLKGVRPAPRLYRILPFVLIALGTVVLHALVDFPLQILSLQLYVATYLGICWASGRIPAVEK